MVNSLSPRELYAEGFGKGPAYLRSIQESRNRIAEYLDTLLEEGLRGHDDPGSAQEQNLRNYLYLADGANSLVTQLSESDPKKLADSLMEIRKELLLFEATARMDMPLLGQAIQHKSDIRTDHAPAL